MSEIAAQQVAVRTRAEAALAQQFLDLEKRFPGGSRLAKARAEAMARVSKAGLPGRRVEEWKYTDLKALLKDAYPRAERGAATAVVKSAADILPGLDAHRIVFVDGMVTGALPTGIAGLECLSFEAALAKDAPAWAQQVMLGIDKPVGVVAALNVAFMAGGVAIRIADGAVMDKPLHLVFLASDGEPRATASRVGITVGTGASALIVESHECGTRQNNIVTHVAVGEQADVTHIKAADVASGSLHLANWHVRLGAASTYRPFQFTIASGIVRHELDVTFDGQDAKLDFGSSFLASAGGHVDTTMVIDHKVPHGVSRELVKGVLSERARGVFQGKVIVRPDAQKSDGKQMARALLLSPDAEFDSKPELEIFADDVVCGHGTTTMELDDELMFYCRSRGIPPAEARLLLVEAFIGEVLDKVEHEVVAEALRSKARQWVRAVPR